MRTSKMMQIFSKEAPMMDVLISNFIEQMRRRRIGENGQLLDVAEGENMNTNPITMKIIVSLTR